VSVNCRPQPLHRQRCRPQAWPDLISAVPPQAGQVPGRSVIAAPLTLVRALQLGPSVRRVKPSIGDQLSS
jgi:hypothetical protein